MKVVDKILILYTDGTYEEVRKGVTTQPSITGGTITITPHTPPANSHLTGNMPLTTNTLGGYTNKTRWDRHFSDWKD